MVKANTETKMELDTIICMTALNYLHTLPDETVDLCVTDPPYGIRYKAGQDTRIPDFRNGKGGNQPRLASREFGTDLFDDSWIPEVFRVLKPHTALYLFTRWDVLYRWKYSLERAGFMVVQRIVWDKALWGMGDLRYFGSQCEDILFCVKGTHVLNAEKRMGNVWRIGRGRTLGKDGARHPTQKPVDLLSRIIHLSSNTGGIVLDPFCGSGSTCIAAQRYSRHFLACDCNREYTEIANLWLKEERAKDPRCSTIPLL